VSRRVGARARAVAATASCRDAVVRRRLHANGVRAPRPLLLKGHVLVMEFIGSQGWPAPRLHDASLSPEQMEAAYVQTCVALRAMFSRCKLVHGDFSEYNLLWFNSEVVVIDVSQSVEWDHPRATEFLRKDCSNVRDFFARKCERVLSVKALYDFVMKDGSADDEGIRAALDVARSQDGVTEQEDRVFMDAFLPRSLQDLGSWPEAAQRAVVSGENENGFDEAVGDLLGANVCSDDDASAATRSESDEEDDGVHGRLPDPSDPRRASAKEAKRAAAKLQKEERREKRKTKLKKHLKKKATKRGR
jgi:RIO kinase 1